MARVHRAGVDGPTILAGDLNTRTPETARPDQERWDAEVRGLFGALADMGTSAEARRLASLDWVLASGFNPVRSTVWAGDSLALPGFPRAELISDHHPEDDLLAFA
jgi:endonuclease/exonuclease/phosphatase (EEP) superfamily protein YafD